MVGVLPLLGHQVPERIGDNDNIFGRIGELIGLSALPGGSATTDSCIVYKLGRRVA